jgi:ATP-dependent Clp protease ATP-binding subunit ClpA
MPADGVADRRGDPEMMERFTAEARRVMVRAQVEARLLHHGFIGCEHLLLGLADGDDTKAGAALGAFGLDAGTLRRRVAELIGRGDQALDAEALASLGIDLGTVREIVESNFGRGALDTGRNQCRRPREHGHIPFTPRAKKSLELALRIAVSRGEREITAGHLLLGVIGQRNNAALQILRRAGVQPDELRQEVTRRMAAAA